MNPISLGHIGKIAAKNPSFTVIREWNIKLDSIIIQ